KRVSYVLLAAVVWFSVVVGTLHPPGWGRLGWGAEYMGVVPPEIREPGHSLILITSTAPIAYVIPAFPPSARFVRIESNFFDPSKRNRMAEQIFETVTKHEGPL